MHCEVNVKSEVWFIQHDTYMVCSLEDSRKVTERRIAANLAKSFVISRKMVPYISEMKDVSLPVGV